MRQWWQRLHHTVEEIQLAEVWAHFTSAPALVRPSYWPNCTDNAGLWSGTQWKVWIYTAYSPSLAVTCHGHMKYTRRGCIWDTCAIVTNTKNYRWMIEGLYTWLSWHQMEGGNLQHVSIWCWSMVFCELFKAFSPSIFNFTLLCPDPHLVDAFVRLSL